MSTAATTETKPAAPAIENRASRGNGERILLVDDEEGIRLMGQAILEEFGYQVLTAENGLEALKLYKEHGNAIDLVLTDMSMPTMDGREEILELRAINPDIKIVASSGVFPLPAGWLDDIRYFISKPYSADSLLKIVRQAIEAPSSAK